jgi:hypothetical protein
MIEDFTDFHRDVIAHELLGEERGVVGSGVVGWGGG